MKDKLLIMSRYSINLIISFLLVGCEKVIDPEKYLQTELSVRLQYQTDHSGVMIKFIEADYFVLTDSTGRFELSNLSDGTFNVEIKYPYFEKKYAEVEVIEGEIYSNISLNLELKQLIQFWIEPAETTLSMNNSGNPDFFSMNVFKQYKVNISDNSIIVGTYLEPINLWAIVPLDNEWPYIPNPDSLQFCYDNYNWFGGTDAIINYLISINPNDTLNTIVGPTYVSIECFEEGTYFFFSAVSDLGHYPEYFDPAFAYGYLGEGRNQLYKEMNRSILKKIELLKPAVVHLIN